VRVGATDESQYNVAASVEGSLADELAAKLVVYYDDDDGYYKNINQEVGLPPAPHPLQPYYFKPADGANVGAMETKFVRPTLVWTPSESVEFVFSHESGEMDGDGGPWTSVTAQRAGALSDFTTAADEVGFTSIDWDQTVLEINIDDVGSGTITNILGMRTVEAYSAADIDGSELPLFAAPGLTDQEQFSNELRWSGSFGENWQATIGAYIFDQDISYREARYIWLPPGILGSPQPFGVNLQRALGGDMDAKNFGLFWSNDFILSDSWTITAGLRYTDEEKTARIITGLCTDNDTFNCSFADLSGEWDNITPKLGVQFRINDETQVYGFWTKGYRSGGFNFRNAKPLIIPPGPTREEENNTYEIGLKTDLVDGRVRINVAAFHSDITDMQRELNLGDPDVIVLQGTINAGDVTIKGVELDVAALITDNFSVTVSYGWQDGEYDSVNPAFASFLGDELPRLAPTNYSVGFSWDIPVGSSLVNIAANHSYRESHPYDDANLQYFDDQRRTNASVNWFSKDDRWNVSLYGKNLEDEANWGNLTSIAGLYTAGPMKKGRLLGLEVNFRY
jgi:iron complex outermembrane receptor protein